MLRKIGNANIDGLFTGLRLNVGSALGTALSGASVGRCRHRNAMSGGSFHARSRDRFRSLRHVLRQCHVPLRTSHGESSHAETPGVFVSMSDRRQLELPVNDN